MILQRSIPYDPLSPRALPGIQPLVPKDWLIVDDAFAAQMAERARLLQDQTDHVFCMAETAREAAEELLNAIIDHLPEGYVHRGTGIQRPDKVIVPVDRGNPLGTAALLVQEDLCILQKSGDEHVLTAAALCFPASWRLSEKYMRPLIGIHEPVDSYDDNIARRVQRMFDGIRPHRPLWRFNALWYDDPGLFQPRSALAPRDVTDAHTARFLRSERQSLSRLPETDAVVFSIHTFVLDKSDWIIAP